MSTQWGGLRADGPVVLPGPRPDALVSPRGSPDRNRVFASAQALADHLLAAVGTSGAHYEASRQRTSGLQRERPGNFRNHAHCPHEAGYTSWRQPYREASLLHEDDAVGTYQAGAFWDNVGRELLQRPHDDPSTIASVDTPFYSQKQARLFEEFLDPAFQNVSSVLEIGQGPGGNLARLRSDGKTVFGVDVSPSMLELARRNGLENVLQMDGSHLPFGDGFCDAVFTCTVLQHNTNEHAANLLVEMARVSAKEVHLFEDTAPIVFRDRQSHWLRPTSWYVRRLESRGYELTFQRRLPLTCQEMGAAFARVLVDRRLCQGAPPTSRRLRFEDILLRIARPVDRVIPPMLGLTRMSFRRAA
jgi:SAM-dependent methyltransferase